MFPNNTGNIFRPQNQDAADARQQRESEEERRLPGNPSRTPQDEVAPKRTILQNNDKGWKSILSGCILLFVALVGFILVYLAEAHLWSDGVVPLWCVVTIVAVTITLFSAVVIGVGLTGCGIAERRARFLRGGR